MAQRRKRFFVGIPKRTQYLILFVNHPAKGESWPGWHLPMRPTDTGLEWWRLYQRQPDDTWRAVSVPRSRDYIRDVPPAAE